MKCNIGINRPEADISEGAAIALQPNDIDLKAGAKARLVAAEARIQEVCRVMAEHEAALAALRSELDNLEFERAAMRFIVEGTPSATETRPLRKVDRQELIGIIKARMETMERPLSVSELHEYLEREAELDLGSNARNYLCGILSKGKAQHFVNLGKQGWWLAGRP